MVLLQQKCLHRRHRPPPSSVGTVRIGGRPLQPTLQRPALILLLGIFMGPYQHPLLNNAVFSSYIHAWKIGNLFRRHRSNDSSNENSGYRNIDSQSDIPNEKDVESINDDFVSMSPVSTETASSDASCSFPSRSHDDAEATFSYSSFDSSILSVLRQSFQIPLSLYENAQLFYDASKTQILTLLRYHPPIGIVSIFVIVRFLLRSKRYLFLNQDLENNENVEDRLFRQKLQQRDKRFYTDSRNQRSYSFNQDDVAYQTFGGIERIRTQLCLASLLHSSRSPLLAPAASSEEHQLEKRKWQTLLIKALMGSSVAMSGSSWMHDVYHIIGPLAQLEEEQQLIRTPLSPSIHFHTMKRKESVSMDANADDSVFAISMMTAKIRLHDSLLRFCRDRVLSTTYRLARTVEHWERRMRRRTNYRGGASTFTKNNTMRRWLLQKIFRIEPSIENDRLCLSLAKAAYTMEVSRLGEIAALLMDRPIEMDSSNLIYALKATEKRQQQQKWEEMNAEIPTATSTLPTLGVDSIEPKIESQPWHRKRRQMFTTKLRTILPSSLRQISKYSFRWKADSKGFLSIRKFDNNSDGYIDGESANDVLLYGLQGNSYLKHSDNKPSSAVYNDVWMSEANDWINKVKTLICKVIRESLLASTSQSLPNDCTEQDFDLLQQQWIGNDKGDLSINLSDKIGSSAPTHGRLIRNREQQYRSIVNYIDSLTTWRRIGEGEKIRLREVFGMNDWMTKIDLLGIPSSIAIMYIAYLFHTRIVVPYWSTIRQSAIEISRKAIEILEQRVWVPLKGIYDDIMNRSPSMMSALGLDIEETSLDRMLQDLNFGDGTPATRQEAIRKATEQYEHDLSHGLFANFARGRLIRLLLIQVQQLKVGMLSALETIDVLIVGNRIHFKVLAAIPAILIASYGTRFLFRGLYNIRAKDIRPISAVHNEMTQYLNKMEKILLLSNPIGTINFGSGKSDERTEMGDELKREFYGGKVHTRTRVPSSSSTLATTVPEVPATKEEKSERHAVKNFSPTELGEMILNTHRYLILLDFSSPQPFPASQCDDIHISLQQFYNSIGTKNDHDLGSSTIGSSMIQQMDPSRQLLWLNKIQLKHQELMKFL